MIKTVILSAGLIAAGMLGTAGVTNANGNSESISISNQGSSSYAAGAYQATITFNVSQTVNEQYSLAITLDNTSEMISNTNLLKGIEFTLSSGTIDTYVNDIGLTGSYAQVISTSPGYSGVTQVSSDNQLNSVIQNANWVVNPITLESEVYQFYGNQGDMLIASSPQTSVSPYPNANNGFFKSANSTVLVNSPIFTLNITDAAQLPIVTLNEVYFGTGSGPGDVGVLNPTLTAVPAGGPIVLPIPATLPLLGGGLFGLGLIALHKRRRHCVK